MENKTPEMSPREGYATTSFLEKELLAYVKAFTNNGIFTGDPHYLLTHDKISNYNKGEQYGTNK